MEVKEVKNEKILALKKSLRRIASAGQTLLHNIQQAEEILEDLENEGDRSFESNALIDNKLSDSAKCAINGSEGVLPPSKLTDFLMKEVFGKPKPAVLPIVKKYTNDVEGLKKQLSNLESSIKERHRSYMNGPGYLDRKLNERIERLLKNIKNEQAQEIELNKRQPPITKYYPKKRRMSVEPSSHTDNMKNDLQEDEDGINDESECAPSSEDELRTLTSSEPSSHTDMKNDLQEDEDGTNDESECAPSSEDKLRTLTSSEPSSHTDMKNDLQEDGNGTSDESECAPSSEEETD